MGASHSVEENPPLDLEEPELEEVVSKYEEEYEEEDKELDTLFLYWWF
jgi:hypothetical protein